MKKIVGKCKQCGKCCRDIQVDRSVTFNNPKEMIRYDFNDLIEGTIGIHTRDNPYLDFSKINEINFDREGDFWFLKIYGVECRALKKVKGKFICTIHKNKPYICKKYPGANSKLRPGCGYHKRTIKEKVNKK